MPLANVLLTGNLSQFTGGQTQFQFDARDIRGVMKELVRLHPDVAPHLEEGLAVAINGEIFQDTWFEPIPEGAEVTFMPAIGGG
ncbi:MAG: MoaD/ThiS family protein [Pseudomonadota bacterium]